MSAVRWYERVCECAVASGVWKVMGGDGVGAVYALVLMSTSPLPGVGIRSFSSCSTKSFPCFTSTCASIVCAAAVEKGLERTRSEPGRCGRSSWGAPHARQPSR